LNWNSKLKFQIINVLKRFRRFYSAHRLGKLFHVIQSRDQSGW